MALKSMLAHTTSAWGKVGTQGYMEVRGSSTAERSHFVSESPYQTITL